VNKCSEKREKKHGAEGMAQGEGRPKNGNGETETGKKRGETWSVE